MDISDLIKQIRTEQGFSRRELSDRAGVPYNAPRCQDTLSGFLS